MESFGDKLRAFGLALAVHILCILAMLIGLWWTTESRPVSVPGPVIEVDLIGPTAAPRSVSVASPKLSTPKPTREMLPAAAPARIAIRPSNVFHPIVKYSRRLPRAAQCWRSVRASRADAIEAIGS
jgi:colicin import membrane protein